MCCLVVGDGTYLRCFLVQFWGTGRNFDSKFSIDDLPKSLLSMVTPILLRRDALGFVVGFSVDTDGFLDLGFGNGIINGRGGKSGNVFVFVGILSILANKKGGI